MTNQITHWKSNFDERELKEIEFCRVYAKDFCHGALGHNIMLIVAKMAKILDDDQLVAPEYSSTVPPGFMAWFSLGGQFNGYTCSRCNAFLGTNREELSLHFCKED